MKEKFGTTRESHLGLRMTCQLSQSLGCHKQGWFPPLVFSLAELDMTSRKGVKDQEVKGGKYL